MLTMKAFFKLPFMRLLVVSSTAKKLSFIGIDIKNDHDFQNNIKNDQPSIIISKMTRPLLDPP